MKQQFYPVATKVRNAVALLLTLFVISNTHAQDVTINSDPVTWGWFNNYPSTTVNGNLTITGAIPDLVELGDSFWDNLTTITGDLRIVNCTNLTSLNGLQHLVSVGGSVIIQNNTALQNLASLENLQVIGNTLSIADNPLITSMTPNVPWSLSFLQHLFIFNNPQLTGLDPFQNITNINSIEIGQNQNFSFINSFYNLQSASYLGIYQNPSLTSIIGFNELSSLETFVLNANTSLQACCGLLPIIGLPGVTNNISGNASGCESLAVIDGPPTFDICPDSYLTSTDPGTCSKNLPVRLPIATDNCDFDIATVKITLGDGSIWFDGEYGSPGNTFNYPGVPGMNTFAFVATDANGNTSSCTTIIEVQDDEIPEAVPGFFEPSYFIDAGSDCIAPISIVGAGFTDPCGMSVHQLEINGPNGVELFDYGAGGFDFNGSLGIGDYGLTFRGADANGLTNEYFSTLEVRDVTAPQWQGDTGKTVTVECGSMTVEEIVAANTPAAMDCGNTSITMGSPIPAPLSCGMDGVIQTFTATDPSNNQSTPYELTILFEDTTAPEISGIPADRTINCTESIPSLPSLTATDVCDGNLTSEISISSIPTEGTCGNGMVAQTFNYTATVTDDCGNEAVESWKVTVINDLDVDLGPDLSICEGGNALTLDAGISGQMYLWSTGANSKTISVNSSGTYTVTVTTANGCCSEDEVNVTVGQDPDVSATGGTITCTNNSVQLQGNSSTSGVSYSWSGPGGFTSTQQNPSVTGAGTYTLTVSTASGCEAETSTTVDADEDIPNVEVSGGIISCSQPIISLIATSATTDLTYEWTGPNDFSSSEASPQVTEIGSYSVIVTAPNGCNATATVEVTGNTDTATLALESGSLTCKDTSVTIFLESNLSLLSVSWTGPEDFTSTSNEPSVTAAGEYTVTTEAVNGCITTESITITEDFSTPNLSVEGGTIDCTSNSTTIIANSDTINVTYAWSGPDGFTSSVASPTVSQPGTYIVSVQGENGCATIDSTTVTADTDLPDVSAQGGTINCTNESVTLIGMTSDSDATILWTGPNGFESTNSQEVVSLPGEYTFTVTVGGGCTSFKTVEVIVDNLSPSILISEGAVNCTTGMRQFVTQTDAENATYIWTGPNGFESSLAFPLYSEAGTYELAITSENTCVSEVSIIIANDVNLTAEVETSGSNAEAIIIGGTGPFSHLWDGELGESTITNLEEGDHILTIVDGFSCKYDFTFSVMTSSTEEVKGALGVQIFPNPTFDFLHVRSDFKQITSVLKVLDVNGQQLITSMFIGNEAIINMSAMPTGVYFVQVASEGRMETLKFVKL